MHQPCVIRLELLVQGHSDVINAGAQEGQLPEDARCAGCHGSDQRCDPATQACTHIPHPFAWNDGIFHPHR
jgi:hypothetical protein